MKIRTILSIVAFAVLGLIAGYGLFGKLGGEYVSLKVLTSFGGNVFQVSFRSIAGIDEIRNKILICGAVGAAVGLLISFKLKK